MKSVFKMFSQTKQVITKLSKKALNDKNLFANRAQTKASITSFPGVKSSFHYLKKLFFHIRPTRLL